MAIKETKMVICKLVQKENKYCIISPKGFEITNWTRFDNKQKALEWAYNYISSFIGWGLKDETGS